MVDILFTIDILVIYNSAFYDLNFILIESYKKIAFNYIRGWFFIDVLAVFPFDVILDNFTKINETARIVRLGRIYKVVKLVKLTRMLKIIT